jgi:hypothetical protein
MACVLCGLEAACTDQEDEIGRAGVWRGKLESALKAGTHSSGWSGGRLVRPKAKAV